MLNPIPKPEAGEAVQVEEAAIQVEVEATTEVMGVMTVAAMEAMEAAVVAAEAAVVVAAVVAVAAAVAAAVVDVEAEAETDQPASEQRDLYESVLIFENLNSKIIQIIVTYGSFSMYE